MEMRLDKWDECVVDTSVSSAYWSALVKYCLSGMKDKVANGFRDHHRHGRKMLRRYLENATPQFAWFLPRSTKLRNVGVTGKNSPIPDDHVNQRNREEL